MANDLDEMSAGLPDGNDTRVIAKKLPVQIGGGSKFFDVVWWILPPIIGGIIWSIKKVNAKNYFHKLQQKMQHDRSQIDNYLEQRVQILKNCAKLLDKAIDLDKDTFTQIARLRGNGASDETTNAVAEKLGAVERKINVAFENYPDLKAHQEIEDAMQQNSYLQREITAAREVYNDTVNRWNTEIFSWPTKQIVAAKQGYTTVIPFAIDDTTRESARGTFF